MMKLSIVILLLLVIIGRCMTSEIKIKSISIRKLRKNDFGLIFDAVISNNGNNPKETLSFVIHSGNCCLLIHNELDCEVQKLIGARINNLEPNKNIIVTLVWPTLVLYNRVGNCSVNISVFRPSGETLDDSKTISFNTTINVKWLADNLLHYFNDMKKAQGYRQCNSEDYDPFNDCKPVNCELKYSGKRNFFKDPICVPATLCDENLIYDYDKNICRDSRQVLSPEDTKEMREGKFTNWIDPVGQERVDRDVTEKKIMLKRLRRSLNEPTSAGESVTSVLFFIFKLIVLICFVYLLMCLAIFVVCSICIGCGLVTTAAKPVVYVEKHDWSAGNQ